MRRVLVGGNAHGKSLRQSSFGKIAQPSFDAALGTMAAVAPLTFLYELTGVVPGRQFLRTVAQILRRRLLMLLLFVWSRIVCHGDGIQSNSSHFNSIHDREIPKLLSLGVCFLSSYPRLPLTILL